jgi:hypothetical protein
MNLDNFTTIMQILNLKLEQQKNEKQRVVPFVDQNISIISVVVHQQCAMEKMSFLVMSKS